MQREHGVFFKVSLDVDIEGTGSISFNMVSAVGLINIGLEHERVLDETIIIEGVLEGWVAFIAFFYGQIDEPWVVDV